MCEDKFFEGELYPDDDLCTLNNQKQTFNFSSQLHNLNSEEKPNIKKPILICETTTKIDIDAVCVDVNQRYEDNENNKEDNNHDINDEKNNNTENIKDLSKRRDVVYKTLVRSIKRFYSKEVGTKSTVKYNANSVKAIEACRKIDEICETNFADVFTSEVIHNSYSLQELLKSKGKNLCLNKENSKTHELNLNICSQKPNFDPQKVTSVLYYSYKDNEESIKSNVQLYHEIKILFACMTIRQCMKGYLTNTSIRSIFNNYYEVVSKYSHKKLRFLLKFGCFRLVLEKFINNGSLDRMINEDLTLHKNAMIYRQCACSLLKLKLKTKTH